MSTSPPTTVGPTTAPTTSAPPSGQIDYPAQLIIYAEPIDIAVQLFGSSLNETVITSPIIIKVQLSGDPAEGQYVDALPIDILVELKSSGTLTTFRKCNWLAWSKIGSLDFTIDESNVAGERPLDWAGCISQVLKLDKQAVAYGENGVTILTPSGTSWGMQTIHKLGVVCKAVGTDGEHFFIDKMSRLYRLSGEGLQRLDYSEYLSILTNPVMSFDHETGIIYICDGDHGYVYSTKTQSFGLGPDNVTGIGTQSGTLYVAAPAEIIVPKFHIATDIYDFGTRKEKTIQSFEIGTDLTNNLQGMVETRMSNKEAFLESRWILVNPSGMCIIPCFGVEFKFHVRSMLYEYFELDYLKVNGVIHGYNYMDRFE